MNAEPSVTSDPLAQVLGSHRPWGGFVQLVQNETVTVKVITVLPGHRLSLQRHSLRREMWQVLTGSATAQLGERRQVLRPGDRCMVEVGQLHRLTNDGDVPVQVLEIAFGHFDEDDIERIEDDYSR